MFFTLQSIRFSLKAHILQYDPDEIPEIYAKFNRKLKRDYPGCSGDGLNTGLKLSYKDKEGDEVAIRSLKDFKLAIKKAFKAQTKQLENDLPVESFRVHVNATTAALGSTSSASSFNSTSESATPYTSGGSSKLVWQKGQLLGQGGFGKVFKAFNLHIGTEFAVKQVEIPKVNSNARKKAEVKSLMNEIDILKSCSHPNIVS